MDRVGIREQIRLLSVKRFEDMFQNDFLLTWEKKEEEISAVLATAEILRHMRLLKISTRAFHSGLAVAIFRDKSTRTRYSFRAASDLLGLSVDEIDEEKSQVAHGETVLETANMLSCLTEGIGIRDDIFLGQGNRYMRDVAVAVSEGYESGVLPTRPTVLNLQCDIDHPTQTLADLLHLINFFGGVERLKGKKIAVTWAYSPSYGKPLSVPQGLIGLMTRFGMNVFLAHPEGYDLLSSVEERALKNASNSGGSFIKTDSMEDAFDGADIVYPKSWAPFSVMEERTELLQKGDLKGMAVLEKRALNLNKKYSDWECSEELLKKTKNGNALYMHCLPADISGVSCERGEVQASVFERYRLLTYREAGYKPYIIAAIILLSRLNNPAELLLKCLEGFRGTED